MKEQVEERLRFYDEGIAPTKNITAMQVSLTSFSFAFCNVRSCKQSQTYSFKTEAVTVLL